MLTNLEGRMDVLCQIGAYVHYYILDYVTLQENPT